MFFSILLIFLDVANLFFIQQVNSFSFHSQALVKLLLHQFFIKLLLVHLFFPLFGKKQLLL